MRVAIIENMDKTHHGQVGVALTEAGAEIHVIRAFDGEPLPQSVDDHDALVVFGGEQNARDDDRHPYLPQLAALMRAFGEADKAVLGICLGSQILARAYGSENLIGKAPEFAWQPIGLTAEGATDPVLSAVEDGFLAFQWHDDTFTLPHGAVHLAHNATTANQAFRVGRAAYGTQFHFEAHRGVIEQWNRQFAAHAERKHPGWQEKHAELVDIHGPLADAAGLAIARAWVRLI